MIVADFDNFVKQKKLFNKRDNLLLACSGGSDSVALFHLLLSGGYKFYVAHCNFKLRDEESDKEEKWVRKLCKKHNITCFVKHFHIDIKTDNIQLIARQLRYQWFNELLAMHNLDKLLTAHHQKDNAETFFINLLRGTGIKGLHGIPLKEGKLTRPLLFATKSMLTNYLSEYKIKFCEDSSNKSNKYKRNALRNKVLKEIAKVEPSYEKAIYNTCNKVLQFEEMALQLLQWHWQEQVKQENGQWHIPIDFLSNLGERQTALYFLFQPFGFNENHVSIFCQTTADKVGTSLYSNTHQMIKERNCWILETLNKINDESIVINSFPSTYTPLWKVKAYNKQNLDFANFLYLDYDKIKFPITLRCWNLGDKIVPFGLQKTKKISDILTNKKVSATQRKNYKVLEQEDGTILLLQPFTIHHHFRITDKTKKILEIPI